MEVVIRRAHEDEVEAIGRLTVAAYAADGRITEDHPYSTHLADAAVRHRDAALFVAEGPGGEVVGTVTAVPADSPLVEICRPGEVEMRMLAVAPAVRGGGVGEALARGCVDWARQTRAEQVILSTGTWMTTAHRLYERLGFVRVPDRDWSPREDVRLIAYVLPLVDPR